ncbi:DNA_replication licensing factor MCM7 [Hexamita inflata]|uniref:DNA helicase n=1 Tax=Hexamita inflata TaxID=28002 RepID=A0ABP1HKE3_9EUKA
MNQNQTKAKLFPQYDYDAHTARLKEFLQHLHQQRKIDMQNLEATTTISLDDLTEFDPELSRLVQQNTPTYIQLMQNCLCSGTVERLERTTEIKLVSTQMSRQHFRDANPQAIGKLMKIHATATFVSPNIPECQVATYYCENCRQHTNIIIKADAFKPGYICEKDECRDRKSQLVFAGHLSKFCQLRIIIIQEQPDEIPAGTTPRTLQCIYKLLPEENPVCQIRPGDRLELTGYLMPQATLKSIFQIDQVFIIQSFSLLQQQTVQVKRSIKLNHKSSEQLIQTLISSFAPQIYGNEMPKLACLCALVGGCPASTTDISIRQNINLLLIGDPGVSKSQLLKFTIQLSTRGVYISGRGATGAGLTASIIRLPGQSEFSLEPGALILSDQGVCCIDEFDKLLEEDRTAIYSGGPSKCFFELGRRMKFII